MITPALNESDNLERLAKALAAQTAPPLLWLVVDTGSDDRSLEVVARLESEHDWVRSQAIDPGRARGGPIVRAFNAGTESVPPDVDLIVKVDADVSFDPDYFERLLDAFEREPRLGIASGTCLEQQNGEWAERHVTGDHVWGACRAYRIECLREVSPLVERMGWDGIDGLKANARGWRTGIVPGLAFRHHRGEGSRDGSRAAPWLARGRAAQYMGYRPSFLLFRAFHHALSDPMALMMILGWLKPVLKREEICDDPVAREYLRRQQRLRELPLRLREARGRRSA